MKRSIVLVALAAPAPQPAPPPTIAIKQHPPLRAACPIDALERQELQRRSEPGVDVFIVRIAAWGPRRGAVVFTHGAGSAGSATWDLRPSRYSLMRKLACKGYDTYAVDVRGFGGSTKPPAMRGPADAAPPVARAREVQADVDTVVTYALATSKVEKIHLFGWSWGCVVAGMYAGEHADRIDRLVLLAPVYDRRWPKRHITDRAWRVEKRGLFFEYHDPAREERSVLEDHVTALFRFTKGDELRLPNGPYQDLYGADAPIWDAAKITASTLVVRGENDNASKSVHAERLFSALSHARTKRYVVLGGAGHFPFRTHQYRALQDVVVPFLTTVTDE